MYIKYVPFYEWGNWGTGKFSYLPKLKQVELLGNKSRLGTMVNTLKHTHSRDNKWQQEYFFGSILVDWGSRLRAKQRRKNTKRLEKREKPEKEQLQKKENEANKYRTREASEKREFQGKGHNSIVLNNAEKPSGWAVQNEKRNADLVILHDCREQFWQSSKKEAGLQSVTKFRP